MVGLEYLWPTQSFKEIWSKNGTVMHLTVGHG